MDTSKKIRRERSFGPYKGVRMRTWGKWVSEVRIPRSGERIWLGSYDSPEKAARAYDAAQYCIRGEHARFNFPGDRRPELPQDSAVLSLSKKNIQEISMSFASSFTESCCMEPTSSCTSLVPSSSLDNAALQSTVVSKDTDDEYRVVGDLFVAPEATVGVEVTPSSPESLDLEDFLVLDTEWIDELI